MINNSIDEHDVDRPELKVETKSSTTSNRFLILGLIFLASGLLWWMYWNRDLTTDDAHFRADVVVVGSTNSGRVVKVVAKENQHVEKGDVLFELDPAEAALGSEANEVALAGSKVEIELADVEVAKLEAEEQAAEARILAATAQLKATDADRERLAGRLRRIKDLFAKGFSSKAAMESAQAEFAIASQAVLRAGAELELVTRERQAARQRTNEARKKREVASIALEKNTIGSKQSSYFVEQRIVRAASAGTVGKVFVREGEVVDHTSRLAVLVPSKSLYVIANLKESDLSSVKVGQCVTVYSDVRGAASIHGEVTSVSPATLSDFASVPVEPFTRNFVKTAQRIPIRIRLDTNELRSDSPRSGMSASVTFGGGNTCRL